MVGMIGSEVAEKLFAASDPLGKTITIDGHEILVIGVGKPLGNVFGQSQDNYVYLPVQSWMKLYARNNSLSINIQARAPELMAQTREEARDLMRARRHLGPNETDHFGLVAGAIGVLVAWMLAVVVRNTTPVPMTVPLLAVLASIGISSDVGMFFGVYPARKAARLDPIEALRYEA